MPEKAHPLGEPQGLRARFEGRAVGPVAREGQYDLVRVGENAWIGNGAIVMADVGARSVVAAGSVVTQPVPDDCVVGGNPARVLKVRDPVTKQWVKPS